MILAALLTGLFVGEHFEGFNPIAKGVLYATTWGFTAAFFTIFLTVITYVVLGAKAYRKPRE